MHVLRALPRFRRAYREMSLLAEREAWSRSDLAALQLDRVNSVWQHAREHVPYYRQLAATHRLPIAFASLSEYCARFPLTTKEQVRQNPRAFLSERATAGQWLRTGGSTGQPVSVFWGTDASHEALRARYRYFAMWDIDVFDRAAMFWGRGSEATAGVSGWLAQRWRPIEDALRNRIRLSSYDLRPSDLDRYFELIARFRPVSLYGFASAIDLLARHAEARGVGETSLKLVTLTGETIGPAYVRNVERALGATAAVEYGSAECGILAQEHRDRTLRVRDDQIFMETLPCEPYGYQIVVSVLTNPSFPLLRYSLADLTSEPLRIPDHGFAQLSDVLGRTTDFIRTGNDNLLHASRFDAFFRQQCHGVRRFRVRQSAAGVVTVLLELENARRESCPPQMKFALEELLEGCRVEVRVTGNIDVTPAGKLRVVESEALSNQRRQPVEIAPVAT